MMEKSIVFSYTQLFMLASAQGYSGAAGLPGYDPKNNVENLPEEINGLVDLGLIEIKDEQYVCTEQAKEIGRRIGGSESFIMFLTKNRLPDFSCFPGDPIMICVPSLVNANKVSIRFLSFEELVGLLVDDGYYPNYEEDLEPDDRVLDEFEEQNDAASTGRLYEDSIIDFSAEKKDVNGETLEYVRIISYYFYRYIVQCGKKDRKLIRFSPAAVEQALKGLVCRDDIS